jgi:hypothetical protein
MNENEKNVMNSMNRELGELKGDVKAIHDKMDDYNREHGRIHIENKEDLKTLIHETKDVANKVGIQNGRVTKIEGFVAEQSKLNSKWDGMMTAHWSRLEAQEKRHSYSMGVLKALGVIGGLVLIAGGYIFTLIIKDISRESVKEVLSDREVNTTK